MIRDDICYLVSENPDRHGVFDTPERTERMVYCQIRSISSAEFWRAHEAGIMPEIQFVLSDYMDYDGEKIVRYGEGENARYYSVIRTYVNGREIEITCEEAKAYVGEFNTGA